MKQAGIRFSSFLGLATVLLATSTTQTPSSDLPTVSEVMQRMRQTLSKATGISMRIAESGSVPFEFKVKAMRPNLYAVEGPFQSFYSDGGGTVYQYLGKENAYNRLPENRIGEGIPVTGAFIMFSPPPDYKTPFKKIEKQSFEGKEVYALIDEVEQMPGMVITLLVDTATWLPVAEKQESPQGKHLAKFLDVKLDEQFTPEQFVWTPPAGAKDLDKEKTGPSPLLPIGSPAPDFTAKSLAGETVSLKSALQGKKALLVNFWFYGCGGCMMEFQELQSTYEKLAPKGLGVLALNPIDNKATAETFVKGLKYSIPTAIEMQTPEAQTKYLGPDRGFPTNYLIGPDGKVLYAATGYSKETFKQIREKLKELGIGEE